MDLIPACVLVIEKHPLMREALSTAISDEPDMRAGMKATTGMEALQLLKVILPDLVLFAMGNPGLDELKALTALRKSLPEISILALTSNEVPGQEQAALKVGACAVLTKAATRAELIGKLREVWNHSDAHTEKEGVEKQISSLHSSHYQPASRMADLHIFRKE